METRKPGLTLFLTEIPVTDWTGMVRWYVETLGLRLTLEDAPHRYALLEAGPGRLALKGTETAATAPAAGQFRLVFEVDDVDAEHDRLSAQGVAVGRPEESREGYRAIRLHDPEGTRITLFSWTQPQTPSSMV